MNYKAAAPFLGVLLFACGAETDASTQTPEAGTASPQPTTPAPENVFSVEDVSSTEAAKLLAGENPPIVLDIRTPREFEAGHIEGAKHIDFIGEDFAEGIAALDKTKTYLIH